MPSISSKDAPVEIDCPPRRDALLLGRTIAKAFHSLPASQYLIPDVEWRKRVYAAYFKLAVEDALDQGTVYSVNGGEGVALWLPVPAEGLPAVELDERIAGDDLDLAERDRMFHQTLLERHPFERGAHHWLMILAVRPDRQGQGLGSALLDAHHAYLDQQGPGRVPRGSEHARSRLLPRPPRLRRRRRPDPVAEPESDVPALARASARALTQAPGWRFPCASEDRAGLPVSLRSCGQPTPITRFSGSEDPTERRTTAEWRDQRVLQRFAQRWGRWSGFFPNCQARRSCSTASWDPTRRCQSEPPPAQVRAGIAVAPVTRLRRPATDPNRLEVKHAVDDRF